MTFWFVFASSPRHVNEPKCARACSHPPARAPQISAAKGADLALDHRMPFCEVSAKQGDGVDDAFATLLRNIITNRGDLLERAASAAGGSGGSGVALDASDKSADRPACCK